MINSFVCRGLNAMVIFYIVFLQAKAMLKKALAHDSSYLAAVYLLVELHMKTEEVKIASEM